MEIDVDVKEWVGVIKDIATTIGIFGGGAWTMYTFSSLGARAKAQAEMFKQAVLDISIDAKQEESIGDDRILTAVATVVNKGTRNTFLDFRKRAAFQISRIEF